MKTVIIPTKRIDELTYRVRELLAYAPDMTKEDMWEIMNQEIKLSLRLLEPDLDVKRDQIAKLTRSNLFLQIRQSYFESAWRIVENEEYIEELVI